VSFLSNLPRRRGLVVVVILVMLAAVGVFGYVQANARRVDAAAVTTEAVSADGQSGTEILLGLAGTAMQEKRLVAPQGSNAYEFYLSVLQLDPSNRVAQENLRKLLPAASDMVERAINDDQLDEAQRELSLLREFDSTNYTLSLLGGKLDAHRQLQVRRDEARASSPVTPGS
jgi:periplasmic protein TonB